MVLFHEEKKKPEKKKRGKLRLAFWIVFWICMIFGFSLLLLSALSGNHKALQDGFRDLLAKSTGTQVETTLNYMGFFPDMRVDFTKTTFTLPGESAPAVSVEAVSFSRDFWDYFFTRPEVTRIWLTGLNLREKRLGRSAGQLLNHFAASDEKGRGGMISNFFPVTGFTPAL